MQLALTVVIGGIRSGKSRFAEQLAEGGERPLYIATAEVRDAELRARVAAHRRRRGACWSTLEVPIEVAAALREHASPDRVILVDSIGMWLNNVLEAGHDLDAQTDVLLESLAASSGPVIVVCEEVGLGGISGNALARRFADCLGLVNQRLASAAREVYWVVAGIATLVKTADHTREEDNN